MPYLSWGFKYLEPLFQFVSWRPRVTLVFLVLCWRNVINVGWCNQLVANCIPKFLTSVSKQYIARGMWTNFRQPLLGSSKTPGIWQRLRSYISLFICDVNINVSICPSVWSGIVPVKSESLSTRWKGCLYDFINKRMSTRP